MDEDTDSSVLSLGLFVGEYLEIPGEDRSMFRFEAAWDSSLHNSPLLNRISAHGEQIFMTISAYLEVRNNKHVKSNSSQWLTYVRTNG
jgi:Kinesin protein.